MDARDVIGPVSERGYGLHSWSPESGDAMTNTSVELIDRPITEDVECDVVCDEECTTENMDSADVDTFIENMERLSDDDLERVFDAADQELDERGICGLWS